MRFKLFSTCVCSFRQATPPSSLLEISVVCGLRTFWRTCGRRCIPLFVVFWIPSMLGFFYLPFTCFRAHDSFPPIYPPVCGQVKEMKLEADRQVEEARSLQQQRRGHRVTRSFNPQDLGREDTSEGAQVCGNYSLVLSSSICHLSLLVLIFPGRFLLLFVPILVPHRQVHAQQGMSFSLLSLPMRHSFQ